MGEATAEKTEIQREYDWDEIEPAVAVLESIAVFEHGEVTETAAVLDPPLHAYIEAEALDSLVRSEGTVSVTLRLGDYHVRIHRQTVEVTAVES